MRHSDKDRQAAETLRRKIGPRSIVMVGLMGCGKSAIGRRIAARLGMPFVDADDEIELAAGKSISDIFAEHGESYFRVGERKVISRLLDGEAKVLATGGGAFMNEDTRKKISETGISIWLKADLPILMRRVARRSHRPLLTKGDPEATMRRLMSERHRVYKQADITIKSCDVPHEVIVEDILKQLSSAV